MKQNVGRSPTKGFAVRLDEIRRRADVSYASLNGEVARSLTYPNWPLVDFGTIITKIQYGCSERASRDNVGTPIIRMNNLQEQGMDLNDLKYVCLSREKINRWKLFPGDILINRTNSKELVGKCEIFDRDDGDWVFASYLIRVQVDRKLAFPEFVRDYFSTQSGRAQIDRESRQIIGMSNINSEEIRNLRIPLPPLEVQDVLIDKMNEARSERARRLQEAAVVTANAQSQIISNLGLSVPSPHDPRVPFAVRSKSLIGGRLDPTSCVPFPVHHNPKGVAVIPLRDVAEVNFRSAPPIPNKTHLVPYVGLPECSLTQVNKVSTRPIGEITNRNIASVGDILFARIEPSIFNRKYVLIDNLDEHDSVYTSGEFYVVRARGLFFNQIYLYGVLRSDFFFNQIVGRTTGSSGRRRLDLSIFESLLIPWPDDAERSLMAAAVMHSRKQAEELRRTAASEWRSARLAFDSSLFDRPDNSSRLAR